MKEAELNKRSIMLSALAAALALLIIAMCMQAYRFGMVQACENSGSQLIKYQIGAETQWFCGNLTERDVFIHNQYDCLGRRTGQIITNMSFDQKP